MDTSDYSPSWFFVVFIIFFFIFTMYIIFKFKDDHSKIEESYLLNGLLLGMLFMIVSVVLLSLIGINFDNYWLNILYGGASPIFFGIFGLIVYSIYKILIILKKR